MVIWGSLIMRHSAALPFFLSRSDDVIGWEITSTTETVLGLLLLDGQRVIIQWRVGRQTDHIGAEIRTDREVDPVQEVVLPLGEIATATVRASRWPWRPGLRLILTAADLRAFESVAGVAGLRLDHPAELVLRVRRGDRTLAREFVGELQLALAELALERAEASGVLPAGEG
jgi:hypothetical protein